MKKLYTLLSLLFLISVVISQNKAKNNLFKHGDKYFKENEYILYDGIVFDMSKETEIELYNLERSVDSKMFLRRMALKWNT